MDLLEVFGGQDNLRLMCGATRFRKEARNRMSFHVGTYMIRIEIKTGGVWRFCITWTSLKGVLEKWWLTFTLPSRTAYGMGSSTIPATA
jgi:hypothetical protein